MAICPMCGISPVKNRLDLCRDCQVETARINDEVSGFIGQGHTQHCAFVMSFGDGECECGLSGYAT